MSEKKKILIIEDNEDLVLLLSNALKSEGFLVASARDGIKGFKLAEDACYYIFQLYRSRKSQ